MRSDGDGSAQASPAGSVTVRAQRTLRGRWEVLLPGRRGGITCETLDEAQRVAYLAVAHTRPCELIVRDAYHRVIHHELIDGHRIQPTSAQGSAEQGNPMRAARPMSGRRRARPRSRRSPSAAPKQPAHKGGQ